LSDNGEQCSLTTLTTRCEGERKRLRLILSKNDGPPLASSSANSALASSISMPTDRARTLSARASTEDSSGCSKRVLLLLMSGPRSPSAHESWQPLARRNFTQATLDAVMACSRAFDPPLSRSSMLQARDIKSSAQAIWRREINWHAIISGV